MTATPYDIPLRNLRTFLDSEGWRLADDSERWMVYAGASDSVNESFEIVLPKDPRSASLQAYVMHSVEILSSLADKSHDLILQDIVNAGRDILVIQVDDRQGAISIPIELAARQIPKLKQLVAYAACSEKTQRTHYRDSSQGRAMAEHFRFGHTVAGSFGYRVESAVGETALLQEDSEILRQLDIFPEHEVDMVPPLERRVMERIARGLAATSRAADMQDVAPLVEGYAAGFNANMCRALLNFSKGLANPVAFNVSWSKKVAVAKDVERVPCIQIDRKHFDYLQAANRHLKMLEPQETSVEGLVTALSSDDDPKRDDIEDRSVIVRVTAGQQRLGKLRIALGKRDYEVAHKAHMDWNTVAVNGVLQRVGSRAWLTDPREFRIIR